MRLNERDFLPEGVRGDLLYAALSVFNESGFGGLTMARVAREAQTSKPRLSYHFKSTDEMLGPLIEAWGRSGQMVTDRFLAKLMGEAPEDLILGILDATFEWQKVLPRYANLTPSLLHLAQNDKGVAQIQQKFLEGGIQRIDGLLAKSDLKKRTAAGRRKTARGLHSIVVGGFLYQMAVGMSEANRGRLKKDLQDSMLSLLKTG